MLVTLLQVVKVQGFILQVYELLQCLIGLLRFLNRFSGVRINFSRFL